MILKHQHNNLGVRSRKCIFLGYSTTSKAYRLYDEENKKFILSRDVIFLEYVKDASTIDRQLSHLNRFASKKFYYDSNNDLPHLEGGIPTSNYSIYFPLMNFPSLTPDYDNVSDEEKMNDSNVSTGSKEQPPQ